jgi:hypothetical protein
VYTAVAVVGMNVNGKEEVEYDMFCSENEGDARQWKGTM